MIHRNNSKFLSPGFCNPIHPSQILIPRNHPPDSVPPPSHRLKRSSADLPRPKPKHTAAAQQLPLSLCAVPPIFIIQLSAAFFGFVLPIFYSKFAFSSSFLSSCLFFNQIILIFPFCDSRIPLSTSSKNPHPPQCPALNLEPPSASAKSPAM